MVCMYVGNGLTPLSASVMRLIELLVGMKRPNTLQVASGECVDTKEGKTR